MPGDFLPEIEKGRPITAEWLNRLRKIVMRSRVDVDASSGLEASQGDGGITLGLSALGFGFSVIKTTSGITARSGTTIGGGTSANAVLVRLVGTTLTDSTAVNLKNISATAGASGKYGFAFQIMGIWFLGPLECS
jgi:hypothetical protein